MIISETRDISPSGYVKVRLYQRGYAVWQRQPDGLVRCIYDGFYMTVKTMRYIHALIEFTQWLQEGITAAQRQEGL